VQQEPHPEPGMDGPSTLKARVIFQSSAPKAAKSPRYQPNQKPQLQPARQAAGRHPFTKAATGQRSGIHTPPLAPDTCARAGPSWQEGRRKLRPARAMGPWIRKTTYLRPLPRKLDDVTQVWIRPPAFRRATTTTEAIPEIEDQPHQPTQSVKTMTPT